jgi:ribosomal-protein-alanine N-acetyltransferase
MDPVYRPGVIPADVRLGHDGLWLRCWTFHDLSCIEEASRDPEIPNVTTVPRSFSEKAGREFIERQWERAALGQGLSLAIVDSATDAAVGLIALLHRQKPGVVGLGYWIVASRRREGYAIRAVSLLSGWALTLPSVGRLEALVDPGNVASVRVLERAHFEHEGNLRGYFSFPPARQDAMPFSLILDDVDHRTQ